MVNRYKYKVLYIFTIIIAALLFIRNVNYFISSEHQNTQMLSANSLTDKKQDPNLITLWHKVKNTQSISPIDNIKNTIKMEFSLSGIVVSSRSNTSFILVNEGGKQNKYRLNEPLESNAQIFVRNINKTSVVFENNGRFEKMSLLPALATSGPEVQNSTDVQQVLADFIIATPIREGESIHGLRLYPKAESNMFTNTLLQPGDVAIRLNNLSLTTQDGISQALSTLLTQQSVQFTVRRSGVPRLINISVNDLLKTNGQSDEGTE